MKPISDEVRPDLSEKPIIDAVTEYGIIFANGEGITFGDMGQALTELGNASLLRSAGFREDPEGKAELLQKAGMVLMQMWDLRIRKDNEERKSWG